MIKLIWANAPYLQGQVYVAVQIMLDVKNIYFITVAVKPGIVVFRKLQNDAPVDRLSHISPIPSLYVTQFAEMYVCFCMCGCERVGLREHHSEVYGRRQFAEMYVCLCMFVCVYERVGLRKHHSEVYRRRLYLVNNMYVCQSCIKMCYLIN